MPPIGNLRYLLVIVDRFSKWPEAFPCAKEDAKTSVLIKSLKPTKVGEPRYLGPATVIAVTRTGVLTDYQPQWIHASRLKYYSTGEQAKVKYIGILKMK
uniref:Uncharacterized protein n=1 Tax=Cyprinus carpio TaxID=7962 RepID=A0A8C1Z3H2_CYPCA